MISFKHVSAFVLLALLLFPVLSSATPLQSETSPAFRKAAKTAIEMMEMGEYQRTHVPGAVGGEAGFIVHADGTVSKVSFHKDEFAERGNLKLTISSDDLGVFHTHDCFHQSDPSEPDIAVAKSAHITVWVASREGLYEVTPEGTVIHVYMTENWWTK